MGIDPNKQNYDIARVAASMLCVIILGMFKV